MKSPARYCHGMTRIAVIAAWPAYVFAATATPPPAENWAPSAPIVWLTTDTDGVDSAPGDQGHLVPRAQTAAVSPENTPTPEAGRLARVGWRQLFP